MGRQVFGRDPSNYNRSRFDYPHRVFELLHRRCGLDPKSVVLEIGPGTGKATRQLLAEGPASILAVEPNPRLARYLTTHLGRRWRRVRVQVASFEEADLPAEYFDLVVAATSFHWLDERRALRKVARLLKPGGWWAAWWNHHGDPFHPSPFSRALHDLYGDPGSGWPDWVRRSRTQARVERQRRLMLLRNGGYFDDVSVEEVRWRARLSTARLQGLWGSFAEVASLPARKRRKFLDDLGRMVEDRFGGEVLLPMVTPIYTARRLRKT